MTVAPKKRLIMYFLCCTVLLSCLSISAYAEASPQDAQASTDEYALIDLSQVDISSEIVEYIPNQGTEDYRAWAQADSRWGSIQVGNSGKTIAKIGCTVTSVTKLIIQCGLRDSSSFNVATLANWLNNNSGYTSGGGLYWGKPSSCVPGFNNYGDLVKKQSTALSSSSYNDKIISWIRSGYHMTICVKNGGHWVAVDEAKSLATGQVYIMDSLSNTQNTDITLENRYPSFVQIHAYTGGTVPSPQPGSDTISINPTTFPSGTLPFGKAFSLQGSVTSNYPIDYFEGVVYDSAGNIAICASCAPNSTYVDIRSSNVNQSLSFGSLTTGSYYLVYNASDTAGNVASWCTDWFSISGGSTTPQMPTVSVPQSAFFEGEDIPISWTPAAGNDYYWINVYRDNTLIVDVSMGQEKSLCLRNASVGSYRVYVSANNSVGTSGSSVCYFNVTAQQGSLRVSAMIEGTHTDNISQFGVFDVYLNGSLYRSNCSSFHETLPVGATYEIKNIAPKSDEISYDGNYSGFRSGTIGSGENVDVILAFSVFNPRVITETPTEFSFNGHTYWFYYTPATWYYAELYCRSIGGHLVTVTSEAEDQFIRQHLNGNYMWIGASDSGTEGNWYWVNGEAFTYSNWGDGEPNNQASVHNSNENYAHYNPNNQKWNDVCGNSLFGFICEYDRCYPEHDYQSVVTPPTCTERGYTTVACARCGDSFKDSYTAALGHNYVNGVCTRCGAREAQQNPFVDVHETDFFFTPVLWAVENGITAGTDETHFSPNNTVMRADAMVFFWAANDRPAFSSTGKTFKDVKKTHWAYNAVMWAVENGITGGTDAAGQYFSPQKTCSRSEILQFLYAAMGRPVYHIDNPYSDVKPKHWYYDGAIWAYENGLERGEGGKFKAKTPCTRGYVVTYLYRFMTGDELAQ